MPVTPAEAGWDALGEGDWDHARDRFREALAEEETPEALEGLGWAGYFSDDVDLTIDSRERAYRAYWERGDDPRPAELLPGWQRMRWSFAGRLRWPTVGCSGTLARLSKREVLSLVANGKLAVPIRTAAASLAGCHGLA